MRKIVELALPICLLTAPVFGQTNSTIQCRPLNGSTEAIRPDEKVLGDQICRAVAIQKSSTPMQTQLASTETQTAPVKQELMQAVSAPAAAVEILPNSVFIAPMNGFETYLAAAFQKKKVPLTVVADQTRAAYVLTGTSEEKKPGVAKMLIFGQIHADDAASVQMVDQRTGAVVFALP